MPRSRTATTFVLLLGGYGLLVSSAIWAPDALITVRTFLVLIPYFSLYVFHNMGIPGLLEHNGLCGFGWCAPTVAGWILLVSVWLAIAWLIAAGIARIHFRLVRKSP